MMMMKEKQKKKRAGDKSRGEDSVMKILMMK